MEDNIEERITVIMELIIDIHRSIFRGTYHNQRLVDLEIKNVEDE